MTSLLSRKEVHLIARLGCESPHSGPQLGSSYIHLAARADMYRMRWCAERVTTYGRIPPAHSLVGGTWPNSVGSPATAWICEDFLHY